MSTVRRAADPREHEPGSGRSPNATRTIDVAVVGGGIAAIFTLWRLIQSGYDAALFTTGPLGSGQTVASQGIVHAGVKFALPGQSQASSRAAAVAAQRWEHALHTGGLDERGHRVAPDLSSVAVLSEHTHLWTTGDAASNLAAVGAAGVMSSSVERLSRDQRPPAFADAPAGVSVFRVRERVLDSRSLMSRMLADLADRCMLVPAGLRVALLDDGGILLQTSGREACTTNTVAARAVILAAGEGNQALVDQLAPRRTPLMQRRPLHMLAASGAPAPLFGHCIAMSSVPRLTVTSHPGDRAGTIDWYIGGGLAERGVDLGADALIDAGRRELAACLPWLDSSHVRWSTLRIDRAEGLTPGTKRPDSFVITPIGSLPALAVWPTKLVLAPLAADAVEVALRERGLSPSRGDAGVGLGVVPGVAGYPWQQPTVLP